MHSTGRTNSTNRRAAGPPSTFGTADPAANTHRDDAENDRLNDSRRLRDLSPGARGGLQRNSAGVGRGSPKSSPTPTVRSPRKRLLACTRPMPPTLTAAESAPGTRHQQHEDVAGIGQASRRQQPARERSPNATTYAHAHAAGRRPGESGPDPHRPGPGPRPAPVRRAQPPRRPPRPDRLTRRRPARRAAAGLAPRHRQGPGDGIARHRRHPVHPAGAVPGRPTAAGPRRAAAAVAPAGPAGVSAGLAPARHESTVGSPLINSPGRYGPANGRRQAAASTMTPPWTVAGGMTSQRGGLTLAEQSALSGVGRELAAGARHCWVSGLPGDPGRWARPVGRMGSA